MQLIIIVKNVFRIALFCLAFCSPALVLSQNVLLIYDDSPTNPNTLSLKSNLENQGFQVTLSTVSETSWNNTNPSLANFDAVIHLNGTSYTTEMPNTGQAALVDFVENEGGTYIGFEWNAYEIAQGRMNTMIDLIPMVRSSGSPGNTITYTTVTAQQNHPILQGIPTTFQVSTLGINDTIYQCWFGLQKFW